MSTSAAPASSPSTCGAARWGGVRDRELAPARWPAVDKRINGRGGGGDGVGHGRRIERRSGISRRTPSGRGVRSADVEAMPHANWSSTAIPASMTPWLWPSSRMPTRVDPRVHTGGRGRGRGQRGPGQPSANVGFLIDRFGLACRPTRRGSSRSAVTSRATPPRSTATTALGTPTPWRVAGADAGVGEPTGGPGRRSRPGAGPRCVAWGRGLIADCHYRMAHCYRTKRQRGMARKSLLSHLSLRGPGCLSIYPLATVRRELRALQGRDLTEPSK